MNRRIIGLALASFACATFAAAAAAAGSDGKAADFPPGAFTDGGRYSLQDLRGKAVVFYFYEKG